MTMKCLEGIDVAVLAGGLGTRINGVLGDTPKVLAPINGKPYLDHLLGWLSSFGAAHIVLCLGHLADKVIAHVADQEGVESVVESEPMGTGGALRLAGERLRSDPVMVMNGDTWLGTDLCRFLDSHRQSKSMVSVLCVPVDDISRYGSVEINQGRIVRFREKDAANPAPGVISAGAYLFSPAAFDALAIAQGPSLERDFLEHLPAGSISGFIPERINFIDIGTPKSLEAAKTVLTGDALQ